MHSHQISTNYFILPSQNLLYHLYHTILQHSQHLNFYFPILLNKIIFLHNKIIYPPITIIYSLFLILSVQQPQILQKTPSPHAHHHCITQTWHHHHHQQPIIYHQHQKKKKKKTTCRNPLPNADHLNTNHPRRSKPTQPTINPNKTHGKPTAQCRSPHHTQTHTDPNPRQT